MSFSQKMSAMLDSTICTLFTLQSVEWTNLSHVFAACRSALLALFTWSRRTTWTKDHGIFYLNDPQINGVRKFDHKDSILTFYFQEILSQHSSLYIPLPFLGKIRTFAVFLLAESVYRHRMQVDGSCVSLDIMDTAGEVNRLCLRVKFPF